jgi:hypothetical protein
MTSERAEAAADRLTTVWEFEFPAAGNHSIHQRGQLAAYLRGMGSKVPNIYGPSADAKD